METKYGKYVITELKPREDQAFCYGKSKQNPVPLLVNKCLLGIKYIATKQ